MSEAGKTKKRTAEEVLRAIDATEDDAALAEIKAMSEEELDASIRADGGDPDAIGERGARLAEELLARRKRLRWQAKARGDMDAALAKMREAPRTPALPRAELIARLEAARSDPRFAAPVTAAFRKRPAEESTDDELRRLLDEIEMLRKLQES
jgi:hypothetical protein